MGFSGKEQNGQGQRLKIFKTGALNHSATLPGLRIQIHSG
jgi:hypothetical protein